ncbi:MAG: hypothetical protein QF535_02495 [Anaerolineales bacterium]|nr:hypothetical protein [Anaerolineales bacterium]
MITVNGLKKLGYVNGVDFSLQDDGDGVYIKDWLSSDAQPSVAAIEAADTEYQAEYDSQAYARNRKAEYDQLNQFEMIFDDDRDGTTTWVDTINEIKGRHPK